MSSAGAARRAADYGGRIAGTTLPSFGSARSAALFVVPLMFYVMLTANLTSLNYKLARVELQKLALQTETLRQDDRIAKLESRERLAALAAQLKMRDPQTYAVIGLPRTQTAAAPRHGIALLGAMNQWLSAAAGDVSR